MTKILLIDDELEKQRIFQLRLESLGYEVQPISSGSKAFKILENNVYNLILLDIFMPEMDGFEVLEKLKNSKRTRNIPVVMLTASSSELDEVKCIELGADDFITKDSKKEIIQARIKNTLRKHKQAMGLNPLTGLSGNLQIDDNLKIRIEKKEKFAVGYADLDHFKEFNDLFGFKAGDGIIQLTAKIINEAIDTWGTNDDFVGHVGGDDFIFVTNPELIEKICQFIMEKAEEMFPQQYSEKIRNRGYVVAKNRQGEVTRIELLSISVAVVTNNSRYFSSPSEISSIASEVKKKAKSISGNSYYIDKRK